MRFEERSGLVFTLLRRDVFEAEMIVSGLGRSASLARAGDQRCLKQIRFDDIDQRVDFFANGRGQGLNSRRAAAVDVNENAHKSAVLLVEAAIVDAFELEGRFGD